MVRNSILLTNAAVTQNSTRKVVNLNTQEIPSEISTGFCFHVFTEEQLQKLVNELPDGITQKHKGKIIPFVRIQIETGNVPVILDIKQCHDPLCKRLFLSAGANHRKCHHDHRHPIERLY